MYASIEIEDDGTPLRRYFLNERDDVLLKIILNCFLTLQGKYLVKAVLCA